MLAVVTMTRRSEVDWLCRGIGAFFPAQWECFRAALPGPDRNGDLVAAYARLLVDPDPDVQQRASRSWAARGCDAWLRDAERFVHQSTTIGWLKAQR